MCGFVGFTSKINSKETVLERMMERIIHRGPDMGGQYVTDDIAMGFRRLSILDLSEAGAQPMQSEDGRVIVTFNGEIYNFLELRRELEQKGHTFHCGADTEVLVHGYEEWGEELVHRLRGMYGFVIWDTEKKTLFGARDIFGIKPFYYCPLSDGSLLYASEIKCFLDHPLFEKAVNKNALRPYLTLQYSATEETFFKGVYKLPAAHCFVWRDGKMDVRRYWDCRFEPRETDFESCCDKLDAAVHESVAAHRIADVKVGAFLSGGIDSSYIAACLMPDNTFSVGFDQNKFNETNYAAELSDKLGIRNYRELLTADQCFEAFPDIQYHMDEPQSNPSSVPLYFLAKLAREHVTVVLSGEGADEIFAGYEWYADTPAMEKFKKRVPLSVRRAMASAAKKLPYFKGKHFLLKCSERPEDWFYGQAMVFEDEEALSVLKPDCRGGASAHELAAAVYKRVAGADELTKKQYLDLNMWQPGDILLKADKMCMAHSLELRVPFLDKQVMTFAEGIPAKFRVQGQTTKAALRHASNKTLPDEWANRPKKGFPVPIRFWLREEKYYNIVKEYFTASFAAEFFDTAQLMQLLDDHFHEKASNQRKIWTVFTFLVWYKRFFVDEHGA